MANPLAILEIGGRILDKFIPDKDLAEKIKGELAVAAMNGELKELEAKVTIITAEANGNWLQRSWRPMTMIWFSILLGMYWFGLAPDYLVNNSELVTELFALLKIGIGGYVVGRSAEKIAKDWPKK